jgi:hypothetical protein
MKLLLCLYFVFVQPSPPSALQVWQWRETSREAVEHAFGAYMRHGWPSDEVRPLSCLPRPWDARTRGTLDDVLGGYGLTLIDSLDTLALLGDLPAFRCAVSRIVASVGFDRDVDVSVFEASIRVVGGLLSAHLLSVDPALGVWEPAGGGGGAPCARAGAPPGTACAASACLPRYEGQLLSMAAELARRLLPAFSTPSGLPYHRVNLRTGAPDPESRETCTAAAGTFLVEFGLLSRLTGDPSFEAVARHANIALWARRSALGLVGSAIDAVDGAWRTAHTGVGSGIDSWLEYLLKGAVLLRDERLQAMADGAAAAVAEHLDFGGLHLEVSFSGGHNSPREPATVSALQAFYPGIEVLGGAVRSAQRHLAPLAALWRKYNATPELYHVAAGGPPSGLGYGRDAPLRPEVIEGTFHLFTATRDASLLAFAGAQLEALNARSRTACGFASIADVTTGRLDDRMDSYFLAETGKYLFLTFDHALKHWHEGKPLEGGGGGAARPRARSGGSNNSSGGGGARAHLRARADALFPYSHPLSHARYDDGEGADAAYVGFASGQAPAPAVGWESGAGSAAVVASLPLDELRTMFTTEGHVLPLGGWPVVSAGAAVLGAGAGNGNGNGTVGGTLRVAPPACAGGGGAPATAGGPAAWCCPVLAPAAHAAPPPPTPLIVALLAEQSFAAAAKHPPPHALRDNHVCDVEDLRAALSLPRFGEAPGSDADAPDSFPSWTSALFSPAELLSPSAFDGVVAPAVLSAVASAKAAGVAAAAAAAAAAAGGDSGTPRIPLAPSIFEAVIKHVHSMLQSRGRAPSATVLPPPSPPPPPPPPPPSPPPPPPAQVPDAPSPELNAALVSALQRPVVTQVTFDGDRGAWRGTEWRFEGLELSAGEGEEGGGSVEERLALSFSPEAAGLLPRLFPPPVLATALGASGGALLPKLLLGASVRCFPFLSQCHTTLFFSGHSPLVRVVAHGGSTPANVPGGGAKRQPPDGVAQEVAARALWDAGRSSAAAPPPPPRLLSPQLLLSAASAQFGPLLTAAGMHALRPALAHPPQGCTPGGAYRLAGGDALLPLPPLSTPSRPALAIAWRGGCTFAEKARLAQAAGASALLVLDGEDGGVGGVGGGGGGGGAPAEPLEAPPEGEDEGSGAPTSTTPPLFPFALADDGSTSEVRIPTALLARKDSRELWLWLQPIAVAGAEGLAPEGPSEGRSLSLFSARARGGCGGRPAAHGEGNISLPPLTRNINDLATAAVRLALEHRSEEDARQALEGTASMDAAFTLED